MSLYYPASSSIQQGVSFLFRVVFPPLYVHFNYRFLTVSLEICNPQIAIYTNERVRLFVSLSVRGDVFLDVSSAKPDIGLQSGLQ